MITHRSRRGKTYYLHERKTPKGNSRYSFSLKPDGILAQSIPDGFEIYENPDAQVFLRRKTPRLVTDEEVRLVEDGVRRYAGIENAIIDVRGESIVIYTPNQTVDEYLDVLKPLLVVPEARARETLAEFIDYSPVMRFSLTDPVKRRFEVERMYYCGEGGWMGLEFDVPLNKLVKKYTRHIGKESFFELA